MALSPLQKQEERFTVVKASPSPSRTYAFDFDTGEFAGRMTDGQEAVRQFIRKAIETARYRFLIYNSSYGCELTTLLGQDISHELLKREIARVITEALLVDDRIQVVDEFEIRRDNDQIFANFTVHTHEGVIKQEVSF